MMEKHCLIEHKLSYLIVLLGSLIERKVVEWLAGLDHEYNQSRCYDLPTTTFRAAEE